MDNLNSILLEGALVADPEMAYTDAAHCRFEISVVRFVKHEDEKVRHECIFSVQTGGGAAGLRT